MSDIMFNRSSTLESPAWSAAKVTPSDTLNLPRAPTTGLYVGVTADVTVDMAGGGTVKFLAVPAGTILPIRVDRVRATGSSATTDAYVALYND